MMLVNKMRLRSLLVCAIASPLFGCVSNYAPHDTENPAYLEFRNTTGMPLMVTAYAETSDCRGRSVIDTVAPGAERSIMIDGGRDFAMTLLYMVSLNHCTPTFSFHPEKNKHYRLLFEQTGDKCYVNLREAAEDGAVSRPVPVTRKKFVTAFVESGSWCEPDDGSD